MLFTFQRVTALLGKRFMEPHYRNTLAISFVPH
jgi:hypothetical protein